MTDTQSPLRPGDSTDREVLTGTGQATPSTTQPGWYPQPDGQQRYWDGAQWTEHFAPAAAAPKKKIWFARHKIITGIGALSLLGVVMISANSGGDDPATPAAPPAASATQAPAPKAAPKPKAPAKPAAPQIAKVGTKVRDGKFEFTVTGVKTGIAKVGTNEYLQKKAQGQFVAVTLSVKNIGNEPQTMFADNQYLFDGQNRKFSADSEASIYDDSSQVLWEEINPGNSVKGKVYFDVPKGTKLAKLELHDSAFSGGVDVAVR